MRIKHVCYPVRVLGPGQRLGIWVAGCSFNCPGCMTPELRSPKSGSELPPERIVAVAKQQAETIDGITISGGEPFDQPEELHRLVTLLCREISDDIIVYSGYTLEQLRSRNCPDTAGVLESIAVLIDGQYMEEKNDGVGLRGSSNQRIHMFRQPERYRYMADCKRQLQVFNYSQAASLIVGLL